MRLDMRFLTVGVALIALLSLVACASGPKAQAPPPGPEPESEPTFETPDVVEEEVRQPVTETLSTERVDSELPEDLAILNARGYLEDVFFATDRFDLSPEARATLAKNASWLGDFESVQILIEGHCDERNTREYNLALGERRANAVREYLMSLGIGSERIRTISYGEERPFALGHGEDSWRLNRRAHFVITAR